MKTQLPSKYPWKPYCEPPGFANLRLRTTDLNQLFHILLSFATTYPCENVFSTLAHIKTRAQNRRKFGNGM